jgi:DNA adenine methylase
MHKVVQSHVEPLIQAEELRATHSTEQFYKIRERFNAERGASDVERAAWLIYLNKTCYNGLFRTNRVGAFNVPVGRFNNPGIVDPTRLRGAAAVLARATLDRARFDHLLDAAQRDVSSISIPMCRPQDRELFSVLGRRVQRGGSEAAHARLPAPSTGGGCLLALNNDTPLVRQLYAEFDPAR